MNGEMMNVDRREKSLSTPGLRFVCSYRLAPKVIFPVPFQDCLKATQHFFTHADEFKVDVRRLALAGTTSYSMS